jgi:hypothetical protein
LLSLTEAKLFFPSKILPDPAMLEYLVELPFPGVPKLRREVTFRFEDGYEAEIRVYTVREGKLYESLTSREFSAFTEEQWFNKDWQIEMPVAVLALATVRIVWRSFGVIVVLGTDRQIYNTRGNLWTPQDSQFWFGNAEYDLHSGFYLPNPSIDSKF